jgi:hypothetical protein
MESIIEPEIAQIRELLEKNPHLQEQFPDGIQDPCINYCKIIEEFVTWFFKARQRRHTESSILEVAVLGDRLQRQLKEIFPERAGKNGFNHIAILFWLIIQATYYLCNDFSNLTGSALNWRIPKFHAIRHVPRLIVMFGSWENVSTQVSIFICIFVYCTDTNVIVVV